MEIEGLFQVNIHYDLVDDSYKSEITPFDKDGYQGRVTDCEYEDGISYTDWCSFVGSHEECENYIKGLHL